jgi:iron complex outermembrane receptor protein
MYSIYGSAGYHHDDTNIRFVFAMGDELTYQAWNGVPEQYITDPALRTFNSAGTEKSISDPHDNEVDDYNQMYYQLHFDQAITPFARWTNALHYTRGKGFFEQYKADQNLASYGIDTTNRISDLIRRRWLDNHFYGFTSTIQIGKPLERYLILGGGWNKYLGDHFGEVIWSEEDQFYLTPVSYYFNESDKRDWNVFGRSNIKFTEKVSATVDLQARWVKYQFEGPDENNSPSPQTVHHRFFNPKLGLQYQMSDATSFYGLTGLMNKEPNRDDYVESSPQSRPRPEKLWDTEIGFRHTGRQLRLSLTGFYMSYKDHLVLTGRLNDVGAYTRVNVEDSYRGGVETSIVYQPLSRLMLGANVTASTNKIKSFDEYVDNWATQMQEVIHHTNTDIAFSPSLTGNIQVGYKILDGAAHGLTVDLTTRYVSKQYVDNTSNPGSLLEAYYVADAGLHWQWKALWADKFRLSFYAKNILDHEYESNGWIYRFRSPSYDPVSDDPYSSLETGNTYHQKGYFPQAGRHFFVSLTMGF